MKFQKPKQGERVIVALDAMGGDYGPPVTVAGAIQAISSGEDDIGVILVGETKVIESELGKYKYDADRISVVAADGVVLEGERPFHALTKKPTASIFVTAKQVEDGAAHAFISAGATGATYVAANICFAPLSGMERGMICGNIFGWVSNTWVLDLGALVDVSARHLVKLGLLGMAIARYGRGDKFNPRLAMLNIGTERGKGNRQIKEADELFRKLPINYVGSVEPRAMLDGAADVVVCDGFVGNVVLKLTEALGSKIREHLESNYSGVPEIKNIASEIYSLTNRALEAGAGPIVGLDGVALVSHGASKSDTIQKGIMTAVESVRSDLPGEQDRFLQELTDDLDLDEKNGAS